MSDNVEPRREFIAKDALKVQSFAVSRAARKIVIQESCQMLPKASIFESAGSLK